MKGTPEGRCSKVVDFANKPRLGGRRAERQAAPFGKIVGPILISLLRLFFFPFSTSILNFSLSFFFS